MSDKEKDNVKTKVNNKIKDNKSNNFLRNFSLLKLKNLEIKQDILEKIFNEKDELFQIIQSKKDNKIITKDNLINYFLNIDNSLDYETVNKIINIYNSDNNIELELNGFITKLLNDIKIILENKKENNNTNNKLSLDKKLPNIRLINQNTENKKNKFNYNEEELYKIKKLIASYSADNFVNLISFQKILNFLIKNEINIDSEKFSKMFDLNIVNDEQLIDLNDCILKINKKIKRIIAYNIIENLNKKNIDAEREKLYMTNFRNSLTEIGRYKTKLNINNLHLSQNRNEFKNLDNNINK